MAVVKTVDLDGTKIIVHDDYYKDKTRKEVLDTLDRVSQIANRYFAAKVTAKDDTA